MRTYYDDGTVQIWHAACEDVFPLLEIGSVDLVLTDPPYSSGGMYRADRSKSTASKYQHTHETNRVYSLFTGDNRDQRSFERWCSYWMADALRITRDGGVIGSFIDWRNIASMIDAVQIGGWVYRGIAPWYKGSDQRPRKAWFRANVEYIVFGSAGALAAGPGVDGICQDGMLNRRMNGFEKQHQTQKPVEVFTDIIGIRPDWQTILDPFVGSGSSLVAAKMLGRRAIGIDISEQNCEIAANRLQQSVMLLEGAAD